jgi:hypothetical protein
LLLTTEETVDESKSAPGEVKASATRSASSPKPPATDGANDRGAPKPEVKRGEHPLPDWVVRTQQWSTSPAREAESQEGEAASEAPVQLAGVDPLATESEDPAPEAIAVAEEAPDAEEQEEPAAEERAPVAVADPLVAESEEQALAELSPKHEQPAAEESPVAAVEEPGATDAEPSVAEVSSAAVDDAEPDWHEVDALAPVDVDEAFAPQAEWSLGDSPTSAALAPIGAWQGAGALAVPGPADLGRLATAAQLAESLNLGFHLGSAVDRIAAAAAQGSEGVSVLREAGWLIERYIALLEKRPIGADLHLSAARLARTGDAIAGMKAIADALDVDPTQHHGPQPQDEPESKADWQPSERLAEDALVEPETSSEPTFDPEPPPLDGIRLSP